MALPYALEAFLQGRERKIVVIEDGAGTSLIPDVVISEEHTDEVMLTRHPVDVGSPISDHAYSLPASVTCTFAWTDSSRMINSIMNGSILKGLVTTRDVYTRFQEIMRQRKLVMLSTGKRVYESVLLTKMSTTSSADTESSLILELTFEEVRLVRVSETTLAEIQQASPERTASVTEGGHRAGTPV